MLREKVLVVDDEADVLDLCRRILENEGYQVTAATNGREAIARAREQTFDLLLTDIKMPGIGGLEVAQVIKDLDSSVICITMTGYSTMSTAIEALRMGVDEFVVKPFSPEELVTSISKALEKVRLRRENIRLRALIPLFELSKAFLGTIDEEQILEHVVRIAQQETLATGSLLLLMDTRDGQITRRSSAGMLDDVLVGSRGTGWQIPWIVVDRRQAMVMHNALEETGHRDRVHLEYAGAGSLVGSPLMMHGIPIGALIIARRRSEPPFRPGDAEMLGILGGQAGIAISNARLFAEIQRAYDELKKLDHMKSEFINIAAHELRTPLAILMGYASILEEESTGETRERLEIVVRNATRLRVLIDDMLNLRYLEMGQMVYHPAPFVLQDLVDAIVTDLAPLARDKMLEIRVTIPADVPQINGDRQKVEIVCANLISNAIKFSSFRGRIRISAVEGEERVVVHVEDDGIGISPDEIRRIFDPFYQVGDSLTREHGGIGLGLTIAKGMVQRCGGEIWVDSTSGKGSRFSFSIPINPPTSSPKETL